MIAKTPPPPYYAVIFTSYMSGNTEGYSQMSELMTSLASEQAGYLGRESVREQLGITVSYWQDLDSIHAWKQNTKHLIAQKYGKEKWYSDFTVRITKVEKEYSLI